MSYYDIKKFDQYPDEPSDAEYIRLHNQYLGDWGESNCYDGCPPKITEAQKEQLRHYYNKHREPDDLDVHLGLATQQQVDALETFITPLKPIERAQSAIFTWTWRTVSNADSQNGQRDQVRLGTLKTASKTYTLVGFKTWQEFGNHCHYLDKLDAKAIWEEIQAAVALSSNSVDEYGICFWVAKDNKTTYPGAWAISIDNYVCPGREIAMWANGQLTMKSNLIMTKQNTITLKGETK